MLRFILSSKDDADYEVLTSEHQEPKEKKQRTNKIDSIQVLTETDMPPLSTSLTSLPTCMVDFKLLKGQAERICNTLEGLTYEMDSTNNLAILQFKAL